MSPNKISQHGNPPPVAKSKNTGPKTSDKTDYESRLGLTFGAVRGKVKWTCETGAKNLNGIFSEEGRAKMNRELMTIEKNGLSILDGLKELPESAVWLANFTSERTRKSYLEAVKQFVHFVGIRKESGFKEIQPAHVIAWRDRLIMDGASNNTVNARLSSLSSLYKHLLETGNVEKNPVLGVKRKKVVKDQVQTSVITARQVRRMLDAPGRSTLKGLRDAAILHIFFYTGCRIAEIGSLKVKDYQVDRGYPVLDFIVKGDKRNKMAINQELKRMLDVYLERSGHGKEPDCPLIRQMQRAELNRPLTPRQINRIFHGYAEMVGLPDGVTPHTPRATFITEALEKGCPIEWVQKTVGHARISTTQMYDKRTKKHKESASLMVHF